MTNSDSTAVETLSAAVAARLEAFIGAWTALSRLLLRAPNADDVAAVRDPALLAVWPLASDQSTSAGLELLQVSTEDALAIKDDYQQLFVIGPLPAPPWESVHRSEEHLIFEAETMQVRAWYAQYGLEVPRLNQDPDDHIGLELEFCAQLAQLALSEPEHAARIVVDLGAFIDQHLSAWASDLAKLIVTHAETDFYRAVGYLLAGTVTQSVAEFVTGHQEEQS